MGLEGSTARIPRSSTWSPSSSGNPGEQLRESKSPTATSRPLLSQQQSPMASLEQVSSGNPNSRNSQSANSTAVTKYSFHKTITIGNATAAFVPAVALIDTMCQEDMVISLRRVQELGKAGEILPSGTRSTVLKDANGNEIQICGFIDLHWVFIGGQRMRNDRFLVVRPDHFDVMIGVEAIARMNLVQLQNSVFIEPMMAHDKLNLGEEALMAILEEKQRQQKAALDSQRLNSGKGQQQNVGQQSRG